MTFHRNSYLVKALSWTLLLSLAACGKKESEDDDTTHSTFTPATRDQPPFDETLYSGCVAAQEGASYQAELRKIILNEDGTYLAGTIGYQSADCKTPPVVVITASGTYTWTLYADADILKYFKMEFKLTSLKVHVIEPLELDHWNGILTGQPVCEGFRSEIVSPIETINMSCLDAEGTYKLKPQTTWTDIASGGEDTLSLSGLAFGHFPAMQAQQLQKNPGEAVLMQPTSYFDEGETYTVGNYSYSSVVNEPYEISTRLAGTWESCHDENLVTFIFSGNTYVQTAQFGVGADCSGSPAYTVSYSGTYTVPDGLDYVKDGFKINYFNTDTKYTVHTTPALNELFNGVEAGTTALCSGFTFTLNTQTSVNGKSCKPYPESDAAYSTVSSSTLYDIILLRDDEIIDSRYTAAGQGSSDSNRPYYFDGDLRYRKP